MFAKKRNSYLNIQFYTKKRKNYFAKNTTKNYIEKITAAGVCSWGCWYLILRYTFIHFSLSCGPWYRYHFFMSHGLQEHLTQFHKYIKLFRWPSVSILYHKYLDKVILANNLIHWKSRVKVHRKCINIWIKNFDPSGRACTKKPTKVKAVSK